MNYELKMILEKIKGDFICVYGEERKKFSSKEEFEKREMEGKLHSFLYQCTGRCNRSRIKEVGISYDRFG